MVPKKYPCFKPYMKTRARCDRYQVRVCERARVHPTGVLQLEKLADNLPERHVNPWCRAGWRSLCLHYLLHHAVLPAIAEEGMVRECINELRV